MCTLSVIVDTWDHLSGSNMTRKDSYYIFYYLLRVLYSIFELFIHKLADVLNSEF